MPRTFLLVLLSGLLALPAAAEPKAAFPVEPDDNADVGVRPRLRVGVEGVTEFKELAALSFRIVLSDDGFDTETYVFDQLADAKGWAHTSFHEDAPGAMFMVRQPLDHGYYEWRADVWNGIDWIEGDTVFRLNVDGTIPAPVEELRLRVLEDNSIELEWDPVTIDAEGRPEYVERYHVYRIDKRRPMQYVRPFEIGITDDTRFVDTGPSASLLFYRVTAEDAAGNHDTFRHAPAIDVESK